MTENDAIFKALSTPSPLSEAAAKAVGDFTRDKMYRLRHIPFKYFTAEHDGLLADLNAEMARYGYIALDAAGEPAVLSGRPPMIPHEEPPDAHHPDRPPPDRRQAEPGPPDDLPLG